MWWKRKKLDRLFDELRAITLLDRLQASQASLAQNARIDPTNNLQVCAMRRTRQSELLAEIARLNSRPHLIREMMRFAKKKLSNLVRQDATSSTALRRSRAA